MHSNDKIQIACVGEPLRTYQTFNMLFLKQVPNEKEHPKAHEKSFQSVDFVPPCNSHGVIGGDEESVCGNIVCCDKKEASNLENKIHNKEIPENDTSPESVEDSALMKTQDRLVGDDLFEGSFKESLPSNERLNALLDELHGIEKKSKKKAWLENIYTSQEVGQLEKENSEVIEELQMWIDDGDHENKVLEEVIEKTNEENVKLLVQISVMQKEMKALEKKNDTLQTELEMKRVEIKRLKGNEHYMEREVRNLKRDLKRKEQNLEQVQVNLDKVLMERQELSDDVDYLEGSLKKSQAANEKLNAQVDQLNDMLKELTKRPCYGHFREEVELLKGSLDLGTHPEELLKSSVEASKETSLSRVIDQLEEQLALFEKENARVLSEKEEELNDMKYEKSRVIDELEDQVDKLRKENSNIITELSEKNKRLCDLQLQVENLRNQNELIHNKLSLVYRSLNEAIFKIRRLMDELQQEKSNEEILNMALELAVNNYVVNEKVHSIKTRELENELAGMKRLSRETQAFKVVYLSLSQTLAFLVNKNGFCSNAGTKIKVCL